MRATSPPAPPPSVRRARAAVSAVFFVHGAVFASWAARVPAVQDQLQLSAGMLGLVMAGPGLGALAGSQAGGLLVHRLGSRAVSASAPVSLCVPLALVPAAPSEWTLMAVLVLLGAADGCTSVAMNAQAVVVQGRYGRTVLNSMHAIRSIGAVAGGLAGVATVSLGLSLAAQFAVMAAVLAVLSAVAACGLLPDGGPVEPAGEGAGERREGGAEEGRTHLAPAPAAEERQGRPVKSSGARRRSATVLLLAVTTFLAALVEDAPASWSGVYLRHIGADAATAAAGYAAFSAGSVVTRLLNDRLVNRLGWVRLIRTGTLCCAAVLAAALLLGTPAVALAAFVVAGAGISAVFPGAFTAAGALRDPAPAMGQIGFAGNLGWLLVPPLIGGLATLVGLPAALGVLVLASLAIAALAPVVRADTVRTTALNGVTGELR
ncbi:MFS transporter [Streptomyces bathyalis]|uniref:MFS transporter n=1 Tax=Streptomyces bathyalis TaxID=2710756 RepID=A0A7T1T8D5_9ACTN|nr:MFS transporter [Streptomyces bathyalis]QPP08269.1 MFS transporter [Streptomyces bathyalis]